ncbi:hypothetical protein AWZ03_002144 [Drosophila navojoa]|uniref:Uncharacterized protein n=1 Tax=Drosophila navojoa TaxID=7232 RepID=A0A484BRB0_DRONA|nr:hypothetical protein AWZ03_002144 [Drosophila navojoa]
MADVMEKSSVLEAAVSTMPETRPVQPVLLQQEAPQQQQQQQQQQQLQQQQQKPEPASAARAGQEQKALPFRLAPASSTESTRASPSSGLKGKILD